MNTPAISPRPCVFGAERETNSLTIYKANCPLGCPTAISSGSQTETIHNGCHHTHTHTQTPENWHTSCAEQRTHTHTHKRTLNSPSAHPNACWENPVITQYALGVDWDLGNTLHLCGELRPEYGTAALYPPPHHAPSLHSWPGPHHGCVWRGGASLGTLR